MKGLLNNKIKEYNGFKFNEDHICQNPQVLIEYKHGHNYGPNYMKITMAKYKDGKLYGGYDYWFVDGGGSYGVYVGNPDKAFNDYRALIYHYLLMFEKDLQRRIKYTQEYGEIEDNGSEIEETGKVCDLKHFLKKVCEYKDLYNPKQLTLF